MYCLKEDIEIPQAQMIAQKMPEFLDIVDIDISNMQDIDEVTVFLRAASIAHDANGSERELPGEGKSEVCTLLCLNIDLKLMSAIKQ
jgi:hypothetical protein